MAESLTNATSETNKPLQYYLEFKLHSSLLNVCVGQFLNFTCVHKNRNPLKLKDISVIVFASGIAIFVPTLPSN